MQNDKEVAKELLSSLKEDTAKVSVLSNDALYSLQLKSGEDIISNSTFESLGLKPELKKGMDELGLEKPSLIQNLAIPYIIKGRDAVFQSKSGTGKTIAFAVGALQRSDAGKGSQILILTPTRELSVQVGSELKKLASYCGLNVCLALSNYIGESINEEIVIGSPGKIIGLINSGVLPTANVSMLIFDEADEMISNQAFGAQTLKVIKLFEKSQKIFFSATYSEMSQRAVRKLVPNADMFFDKNTKAEKIQLFYVEVLKNKKIEALKTLFEFLNVAQTIIFVNNKHMADTIKADLEKDNYSLSIIHGNLMPEDRDSALIEFLNAKTKILVSTNVFARGMDIPQVNLIINFDIPKFSAEEDVQTYIHRIGRSGRFNRSGFVIDFVSGEDDLKALTAIQTAMGSVSKKFTLDSLKEAFMEEDPLL